MPKANITLPNGTTIEIDGTVEEVQTLTAIYSAQAAKGTVPVRSAGAGYTPPLQADEEDAEPDIAQIVSVIRDCDEAEIIERRVLDGRSVPNRVLLPLYILNKYLPNTMGLTSGDIEKITDQLGVKVAISSASTNLSGAVKSYVTGDAVRKKGAPVRYKLNRRGVQYFEELLK
ncbi:MAG: hypothetical protein ACKVP4_13300 [Hyphomicrobium sp.]